MHIQRVYKRKVRQKKGTAVQERVETREALDL